MTAFESLGSYKNLVLIGEKEEEHVFAIERCIQLEMEFNLVLTRLFRLNFVSPEATVAVT